MTAVPQQVVKVVLLFGPLNLTPGIVFLLSLIGGSDFLDCLPRVINVVGSFVRENANLVINLVPITLNVRVSSIEQHSRHDWRDWR